MKLISQMGHVALRTPDLDASVRHATDILGLREVERTRDAVYLTCGRNHHDLQLIRADHAAFDHFALEAAGDKALDELLGRLERSNVEIVSRKPEEPGIARSVRFVTADGHTVEVYVGMEKSQPAAYNTVGVRPRKYGHTTIAVPDVAASESLYSDVLGFIPSDRMYVKANGASKDVAVWMRCNSDHHGLALIAGEAGLRHCAWEVESFSYLAVLGDHLAANGIRIEWGPGRHGPGNNLYTYHRDPAGNVHEHLADIERIYDDSFLGRAWELSPATLNLWGGPEPSPEYRSQYLRVAVRK
jgi:catechol 2,3-dioxygenase-like lactoylglutathione lyase family enzyme